MKDLLRRTTPVLVAVLAGVLVFTTMLVTDVSLAHTGIKHRYNLLVMAQDPNQTRTAAGLPMLTLNRQLTKEADHYAQEMCNSGDFRHAKDIMGDRRFGIYGENIGRTAGSPSRFERAFAESPGHYANIVRPEFTHLGVGVCRRGPTWFVVYRFGGS